MPTIITPEYLARTGSEHAEQMALFCWANMAQRRGFEAANDSAAYPVPLEQWMKTATVGYGIPLLEWMYAIPNGGGRSPREGLALKAEGVKGGVADVCLPVPMWFGTATPSKTLRSGLYIEMKRANGVPSDVKEEQYKFGAFVTRNHYVWNVCFGWKEASVQIEAYLTAQQCLLSGNQTKVLARLQKEYMCV